MATDKMTTGVTAESALSNFIQGHLECSICCHRFREPKMLQCAHNFCLKCLQELKQSQQHPRSNLVCPLCQKETILPEDGMDKLSNNYSLISLLDEVTKQEQLLEDEGIKILCQACDEENVAISQCLDCEHYLCQECEKAHKRMINMKAHKIMDLTEMKGTFSPKTNSTENIFMCEFHINSQLCFYCNSCEQLLCKQCTATIHKGFAHHKVVDLSTAIDLNIQRALDCKSQVDKCDALRNKSGIIWASLRNRLSIMLAETKSQITKKAVLDITTIKQKEQQLLQEAELAFRRKDKKLAELILAEQTVKMVRRQTSFTDKDRINLLKLRKRLLHDYKDQAGAAVTNDIAFISFKGCHEEIKLGTLLLQEKWEKMGESQLVKGKLIASFSTGDMVVVNWDNPQKLTKLNKELVNIGEFEDPDVINEPTAIAVNKDDELIVLDSPEVKIFSQEYQLLHKFTAGGESKGVPTCLAVDDSNMIAVGYEDKEEISLHYYDGSLIKTLPAPMIASYMTISNQQCYYTNYDKQKFICVDFQGNIIFKINKKAYGMFGDKANGIFIISGALRKVQAQINQSSPAANPTPMAQKITFGQQFAFSQAFPSQMVGKTQPQSPSEIYSIKRCTTDGKFIQCIAGNISGPLYDVAHTPDGRIAVTGENHTSIYHRV